MNTTYDVLKIKHSINSKQQHQGQHQGQPHGRQEQITNYNEPEEITIPDYTLPYQDVKCMEFIQSTEIKYIKDSSMLNGFFGMSNLPKRTIEYSFQTPNYPSPYPLNIECIKVIAAPTDQHRIVLHFRGTFELEPESHCTTDFLEIRDGAFGFTTLLGRFCSKQVPDLGAGLISTGQYMWLRFHSDSTIAHRGFQAVYRFIQTDVQFQINLQPGQAWKLDEQYLLMKMEKLSSKIQQLPLEVALDIRSTNGTYIMLHINHVQVPQSAAWSCQPESTFTKLTRIKCLTGEPIVFGLEKKINGNDVTDSGLNKLSLQDPSSIIDGQHTFFEVYPGKTISQFVPPCPKIIRFCDKTIGLLKLPKNHGSDRDFYIRYPRLIIRIVIASPYLKPDLLDTIKTRRDLKYNDDYQYYYYYNNFSSNNSLEKSYMNDSSVSLHHHRRRRQTVNDNKINEKLQEYMPKFVFILTSLKRKSIDGKPCVKDWEACDSEVCIPKRLWCDDIINCPQWQDEGGHCTRSSLHSNVLGPDGQLIQDTSKSAFELRKEQEQLEAEAERLAAQKLHLSILATLGLILLIVTSTCIFMTIRRRRRETARQFIKSKEDEQNIQSSKMNDRRLQRLNHVMSTGALLERNIQYSNTTHNSSINNNQSMMMMRELKSMKKSDSRNTTMIWNSTDSIHAPLLWQRKGENIKLPSSSQCQMNSQKNLIKYSLIKTKGNNNNSDEKVSKKKINSMKQCSIEKETIECIPLQDTNTTNTIKSSIGNVNKLMNESISLPNTTISSVRTMTNILHDKSIQPLSLTHTYGSYPITSYEQNDICEWNKHTLVQKRMIEQQQQEQIKRSGNKTESHSVLSSPQNHRNWIATNIYPKIDKQLPIITNTQLSQTDHNLKQKISNINSTINRTQSWGGGLRYNNNNNVHIYCEQDNQSPSIHKIQYLRHFKPSQLSSIPKCQLYSVSNSQEHLYRIKRSDTYVSMPDVNGLHDNNNQFTNYHHKMFMNTKQFIPTTSTSLTYGVGLINIVTSSTTTCTGQFITSSSKDYRPPQAKRPRIINSLISSTITSNNDNTNNKISWYVCH
ncbi:neuropilin (nrp) and tolloid (tll)-like [Schistosoma mansoni]|uniref:neuropilin (nrp) and tolloid (tll)-like n=1 Tax=Schistosoma mansoni TaxID=6183 RepID=UPI0001A63AF1|nr:neuropilin (nrp) and tolloid (tll)-like [Schistosoma mansoni]|eukprot:XP_018652649.1 neuropilin (nrp) and tolloid (tll)-like [Schistosoma mansoni]